MTHVEQFANLDEMVATIQERQRIAHEGLHHAQAALTWGDYWVRFIDVGDQHYEFGWVFTPEQIARTALDRGSTWEETVALVGSTAARLVEGFTHSMARSKYNPDGAEGEVHKGSVWPIEPRMYLAAEAVGFDPAQLDEAMTLLVAVAYQSQRAHFLAKRAAAKS